MFRLWEGRFEPLLRRAAPDFGEFVSLEAVPPTENVPRPSVAKGLRNRLTGTAIRRDRVPQWLKPSVWPFYLIIVVAVAVYENIFIALAGIGAFTAAYLLGLFLPLRMAAAAFGIVTRPFKGIIAGRIAARALRRRGLHRRRLGWTISEWSSGTESSTAATMRVLADHQGLLIEGRCARPSIPADTGGQAGPRSSASEDDFLLEDRVAEQPNTWRRTGDAHFEGLVQVTEGRRSALLPALLADPGRRSAVATFLVQEARQVPYRCEIEGPIVRARLPLFRGSQRFLATYNAVERATQALSLQGPLSGHLATGADSADLEMARAWCLGVLLRRFNGAPEAQERAESGRNHPDLLVKLWSAVLTESRDPGLCDGLLNVSKMVPESPSLKGLVSRALVLAVGDTAHPDPDFLPNLARAMAWGDVRVELLKLMAARPWGLDGLVRLTADIDEPMKGLIYQLLRDHAEPRFEAAFIAGLGGPTHLQLTCLEGLRAVGTLEAVAPLMPLRDKMFGDARVRARARETINSIQGRAPRGAQGQLSLVQQDHQVGRVSLADPEPQPSASQPMDSDEM